MHTRPPSHRIKNHSILAFFEEVVSYEQIVAFPSAKKLQLFENEKKVFVVKSGILKVGVSFQSDELVLGFVVPGDIVGVSFFSFSEASYFVETITPVWAYSWETYKINELISLFPEMKSQISNESNLWAKGLIRRVRSLGLMSPRQRVMDWVQTYLSNKNYIANNLWEEIDYSDMAGYCALEEEEFRALFKSLVRHQEVILSDGVPVGLGKTK